MLTKLIDTLLTAAICLAILTPFVLLFILFKKPRNFRPLKLFALFFLIHALLVCISGYFTLVPGINSNWQASILSIIAALICMACSGYGFKQYGLGFQFKKNWWVFFVFALVYCLLTHLLAFKGHWPGHYSGETVVFRATLPGLDDEIWFRAIYLLLFNELLGRPVKIGKLQFGLAVLITAILFGVVQGVSVHQLHISIHWQSMKAPLISGLIWALVTEAAGNIWPAVFLHNFSNTLNYLLGVYRW